MKSLSCGNLVVAVDDRLIVYNVQPSAVSKIPLKILSSAVSPHGGAICSMYISGNYIGE